MAIQLLKRLGSSEWNLFKSYPVSGLGLGVNALNVYNRYHYHFMGEVAHFFLRISSINNFCWLYGRLMSKLYFSWRICLCKNITLETNFHRAVNTRV